MNEYPEKAETPDIKIAELEIWIHGYQFPDSNDFWDGNQLNATATCASKGASVRVSGSFIHLSEIEHLETSAETLHRTLDGKAELSCMEPELHVELEVNKLGQIEVVVNITPDYMNQDHSFTFEIDQSYLPELISECKRILQKYPIRGQG